LTDYVQTFSSSGDHGSSALGQAIEEANLEKALVS
jgi:hypothetical protein